MATITLNGKVKTVGDGSRLIEECIDMGAPLTFGCDKGICGGCLGLAP